MTTLNINGHDHSVDVPSDTPLLWVIREHLQMTGTKSGCGAGLRGTSTVHFNGEAARSCQTAVSQASGKKITTIEGLDPKGEHPFGAPGPPSKSRSAATASLGNHAGGGVARQEPRPDRDEIVAHMDGNLCRCMTYARFQRAILRGVPTCGECKP